MSGTPLAVLLTLLAAIALAAPASAQTTGGGLVVNEIDYDQVSTDTAEFVEVRNNGDGPVDLGPYLLRFVNGANGTVYDPVDLPAVSLAPGDFFVVCANAATVPNCDLDDAPDTDFIQNGAPDAVALLEGETIVDTVSYEGNTVAPYTEGTGTTAADSNSTGFVSLSRAPGGVDTNNNAADLAIRCTTPGAPNAVASSGCTEPPPDGGGGDQAPRVTEISPPNNASDVATDANVVVTFSEPVNAADAAFEVRCNGQPVATSVQSNPEGTRYTLDPAADLPRGASCTVTVRAAGVSDRDAEDPPDRPTADFSSTFSTLGLVGLRIHEIQGAQHRSPFTGALVSGVPGVVTARRSNGFFYQDPQPDGDERTSEALFVFTGGAPPAAAAVGSAVRVSGRVTEFRPGGASTANLTTTEITQPTITPDGPGATIAPTTIGDGGRVPPSQIIDNDSMGDVEANIAGFDPAQDGIDFYESLEAMLTQVNDAVVVGPSTNFGEIWVLGDDGRRASLRTPRGGIVIRPDDFNPERIQLDDVLAPLPDVSVRDRFAGPVRAVVDYDFGNFQLLPLESPQRVDGGLQREVTAAPRRDQLATATLNVENLDPGDGPAKFGALAQQIVGNLRSPDLLSLEEVQDDNGPVNDTVTDASATYAALIAAIAAAGGPAYDFRQIDPVDDQDGGEPGGNIRVGFLFRTDRGLSFVDRPGGTSINSTGDDPDRRGAQLTFSPGRIDPTNGAFANSRKPLAGEFRFRGRKLFAVANHFNSKGGDDPLFGRFQPPKRPTEVQRHEQARIVNAFVDELVDAEPTAQVIVLGDLNDFDFSETLRILKGREMLNLMDLLPRREKYSYDFEGNSQVLDQILVTWPLLLRLPQYDSVHVNSEFHDQVSDHDPQVARFWFPGDSR